MAASTDTVRIDARQKELLFSLFIRLKAHRWNKSDIKQILNTLKESENNDGEKILSTLKYTQIKYQFDGYLNDIILRKAVGTITTITITITSTTTNTITITNLQLQLLLQITIQL